MTGEIGIPLMLLGLVLSGGLLRWLHRVIPFWLPSVIFAVVTGTAVRMILSRHPDTSVLEILAVFLAIYGAFAISYFLWPRVGPIVRYPFLVTKGLAITARRKTDALAEVAKNNHL